MDKLPESKTGYGQAGQNLLNGITQSLQNYKSIHPDSKNLM
ncbi:MAG: hypothetical protein WAP27_00160 [Tepidanaerobacteraceae bacterium]